MWRYPLRPGGPPSLTMGAVLVASFVLTVASFLLAIVMLTTKARGISAAAESIASNAAPAVDHLSRMRTALRHAEVLLDDFTDQLAAAQQPHAPAQQPRAHAQRD